MINFFRKIRQQLLTENKFSKYLLYAIGEIVLVVIGILIALQINNWNESQKDRKAENKALISLKQEFDENDKLLNKLLIIRKKQEKQGRTYLQLITDDTIPITQKIAASTLDINNSIWGVTNTVLNGLVNSGGIDRIQNDSLKVLLSNWPNLVDRFKKYEERYIESVRNLEDYENSIIPRPVVKNGNYSHKWPGNYYPNSMDKRLAPLRKDLIKDIKYYNLIGTMTNDLYGSLVLGTDLRNDYKRISQLIIKELNYRGIHPPEN
jgi:hypothetical protein